jgi:hypothetical protein
MVRDKEMLYRQCNLTLPYNTPLPSQKPDVLKFNGALHFLVCDWTEAEML